MGYVDGRVIDQVGMDAPTRRMVEDIYDEAADEAIGRGLNLLTAHKEGVVAAAMMLAALLGLEDEVARASVIGLNLRPHQA